MDENLIKMQRRAWQALSYGQIDAGLCWYLHNLFAAEVAGPDRRRQGVANKKEEH